MMKTISLLMLLIAQLCLAEPDPAPKYINTTKRLFHAHEYVQKNGAPDFWGLMPYYLPQQTGSACSIASVVMVLNAARAKQDLGAKDTLITQQNIFDKVKNKTWKKAVSSGGGGVTLDELGKYVLESAKVYGFANGKLDIVHADPKNLEIKAKLHEALVANEKNANDFIIVNFLQSEYTGDPEGAVGHIAPVAAYDEKNSRVLIFDPDREYYEPYWVSEDTLLKGMMTTDKTSGKSRGFIWIRL